MARHAATDNKPLLCAALVLMSMACAFFLEGCTAATSDMSMNVTILKVGKADAIIAWTGKETLMIDCGEEDDGQEILEYLAKQGIGQVDTLIITHFDKDHVGGADIVIENIPVSRVIAPDYESTSTAYTDFLVAMKQAGITPERLTDTANFSFGDAEVIVEPPLSYEMPSGKKEYDNNFSLITTIIHGDMRLVFMGDAEKKRIREWLASSGEAMPCDFLKVPHHGVYNKALPELFERLSPSYAAICDSEKNPADDETIELLRAMQTGVFETKNGKIKITGDGKELEIRQ